MDVTTHLLVPYAAALAALGFWRRGRVEDADRAALALAVGLSGFAPDLDGLLDPLSERVDALWWLQHRGASHTLWGAPILAAALLGALGLLARRFPRRLALLRWRATFVPAAIVGGWSHLLLDAVTLSGVPLLWPLASGRIGWMLFHWLVPWLFPLGVVVLGLHAAGRLPRRHVLVAGAFFVAALVVLAGLRVATRPTDLPDGARVYPRGDAREWIVATPLDNGTWHAALWRDGAETETAWFEPAPPPPEVIEAARATNTYRGFRMGAYGPEVVQAEPLGDEAWRVRFVDVAQRFEALHGPRWTPTDPHDAWGHVVLDVRDGRAEARHRGW